MRAIIIEEKDVRALVEQLELKKHQLMDHQLVDEIHRHFHYVVVKWLQEQGSTYPN